MALDGHDVCLQHRRFIEMPLATLALKLLLHAFARHNPDRHVAFGSSAAALVGSCREVAPEEKD
jgi:hypothetical protein